MSEPELRAGSRLQAIPLLPLPLVGREADAVALDKSLRARDVRLVTLTGPGGVGKTSLAISVATGIADHFVDGAVFVDLAPVTEPDLMITAIAQALGLHDGDVGLVQEYLRDRQMLLLLDNFEHLLPAAATLARLSAHCPLVSILITSRAPLRIRGEREFAVEPLATPDSLHTPDIERVLNAPAAQLFIERARGITPSFTVNDRNAAAIAAICWRLEGLPLALELAAAQTRYLGPMELLARLDDVLQHDGARDLPRRQRTMRATLDWSYGLLTTVEQVTFRRLSVLSGGFEFDATEAACTGDDLSATELLNAVGSLVEQSLVTRRTVAGDITRYRMLEPTRQYAASKLEALGEEAEVKERLAVFYSDLARRARLALRGPDQVRWLDRLDRDYDNLRSACEWLLERGDRERAIRLVWALWLFWPLRGHASETRQWMDRALGDLDTLTPETAAKGLWLNFGLALACGDLDGAVTFAEASLARAKVSSDPLDLAHGELAHATVALSTGDLATARHRHAAALERFRALGDSWGVAVMTVNLGQISLLEQDLEQAADLVSQGEVMARAQGDAFTLEAALILRAAVASTRGAEDEAEALLREGLSIATRLQDVWSALLLITALAGVATRTGDLERAARLFGAAGAIRERMSVGVSWSLWRERAKHDLDAVRAALGPERFASLYAEGRMCTSWEMAAA